MKRLFYSVLTLVSFGFSINSNAQCTPDPTLTDLVTYPQTSTISNDTVWLPPVTGPGYSSTFYVNIPANINNGGINTDITTFKLVSLTGLPSGLDKQCNPSNCEFPGGQNGCIEIFGDVDNTVPNGHTYILDIQFSADVTINGFAATLDNAAINQIIGTTYVFAMKTGGTVGVEELGFSSDVALYPNPTQGNSVLSFDAKTSGDLTISVLDVQGRTINWFNTKTVEGNNSIDINTNGYTSGIYQVVLSNANGSYVTKLVVE